MTNRLTAKQAKELTDNTITHDTELKDVLKAIEDKARSIYQNGYELYYRCGKNHKVIAKELEKLGYKVIPGWSGDFYLHISWKE